jgi:hypothetical protein
MLVAEGRVFQGVNVSLVRTSCQPELCGVPVSMIGAELSEVMGRIWPRV